MGLFDEIKCNYTLPVDGFTGKLFQTKSLDCGMDMYEIRSDGTLWREDYDIEDQSKPGAEGLESLIGCMARVNRRWRQMPDFTGEIRFYDAIGDYKQVVRWGWIEFSAYFTNGEVKVLNVLQHREPVFS